MKRLLLAMIVASAACAEGAIDDTPGTHVTELSASNDTYRTTGIETWRKVEAPPSTTIEGLAGDGRQLFHIQIAAGRKLVTFTAPAAQTYELQADETFRPLGSYTDRSVFDLFGRYLDDALGGKPVIIDGQEVHAAPGPNLGGSRACESAQAECLFAMTACINPISGCALKSGTELCCLMAGLICRRADAICRNERGRQN